MEIKNYTIPKRFLIALLLAGILISCHDKEDDYVWKTITVTATAYNSVNGQTKQGDPEITAWGDRLTDDIKSIAVSRDLIKLGLDHNTRVRIDSLPGTYKVLDKMNKRWKNRIDIHLGKDVSKAREWGRKKVVIHYAVHKDSIPEALASN